MTRCRDVFPAAAAKPPSPSTSCSPVQKTNLRISHDQWHLDVKSPSSVFYTPESGLAQHLYIQTIASKEAFYKNRAAFSPRLRVCLLVEPRITTFWPRLMTAP